jgi:sec-independent protein translocase protein TatB
MFDLTSSKLLILGVVALIVVGPKELPFLLRTIGKYVAMIRRQANEFRAQFDEAMREAELDSIRKDVENVARDAENSLQEATASVDREIHASQQAIDTAGKDEGAHTSAEPVHTYDPLNGLDTGAASSPHTEVATAEHAAAPISVPLPAHLQDSAHVVVPPELAPVLEKPVLEKAVLAKTGS